MFCVTNRWNEYRYSYERAGILSDAGIYERLNSIRCVYACFSVSKCLRVSLLIVRMKRYELLASVGSARPPLGSGCQLFSGLGSEGGGARLKQQALNEMSCWIYASLHLATLRATLLSRALIGRSDDA